MLVFELDREIHRVMPRAAGLITSAGAMASFLHRGQIRFARRNLPRVPYVEHPLRVALRLIRWGVDDAEVVASALLHDVVEDCAEELLEVFGHTGESALECLARLYGAQVADLVGQVTNPGAVGEYVSTTYSEHIAVLSASGSSALVIKASDLKDNAGSIKHQLGHGHDQTMLRLLRKYLPVVTIVADSLLAAPSAEERVAAAADLHRLANALRLLALEHGIEG
ncbi:HD domain-containing protein [Saccharothrix sp. AJ9571]|nr:HD domain-containing protein [Saccharothrix sp. AJ9571]